jgi:hypothetical protein
VLAVSQDFAPVHRAIEAMLEESLEGRLDVFSSAPFRRASLMPALFARLGMPALKWCCVDATGMPPAAMESHDASAAGENRERVRPSSLEPFYRYCATCHQTPDRFPPNFLQGTAQQVSANLAHCAPRLYARLAMWTLPGNQRPKTPMPPHHALHGFRVPPDAWRDSSALAALKSYVQRALEAETGKPPRLDELMRSGYENLRACLPEAG